MNTGYSLYNPGGSLNFDIPLSVIQANEEDEAAEDARLKERELQDILTNAFDDITDDEYDGSLQTSPTQNSLHSEHSLINYADTYDDREHTSPPFVGQSEQQYDYPPKKDLLLSNTNEEFQQMEPEICNGETSEETTNEQQLDKNVVDNDWEGRYYVDHWEEASDDHLHSGEVADNVIVQRNSLGDDSTSKANTDHQHCFAYQPYNSEANRLNMIAFRPYDLPDNDEALQAKFLNPVGETNEQIKFQQIQILYNARGREIQKLQQQLDNIRMQMSEKVESQARSLDAYREENSKNLENLKQCHNELDSAKLIISKLEGQLRASDVQLVTLTSKKNEIIQQLQIAESTIESLQSQIDELQKSENLIRARENHAAMLTSLKEKHNEEVYKFKVEIDELKETLSLKDDEVEKLKENLRTITKECEEVKMEKAETVNRLIKALEESQQECQKLVKYDKTTLNTLLNAPLSNVGIDDEVVKKLREELASTKEELELYTSATRLGIINDRSCPVVKDQKTQNLPNSPSVSQDNLLSSLKSEVERSLACLQSKNEQLRKLHSDWQGACAKLKLLQQELDSFKVEKVKAEMKIATLTEELQAAKENLKQCDISEENVQLKQKLEGITHEYNRSIEKIDQLTSLNRKYCQDIRKLKEEMMKLVQANDEDKRKAIDECREACLQLHSDATEANRALIDKQLMEIQIKNQRQVGELVNELDNVKTIYVKVCEEKNELESKLQAEWSRIKDKEIENVKLNLEKNYEEKLQRMKAAMEREVLFDALHTDEAITKKVKGEVMRQVEEQLQAAKRLWEKEHELNIEEEVAAKAKQFLELHLLEKAHESSDGAIDDYLEQIQELENRVKETQDLYKQNLVDLEKVMVERKEQDLKKLEERLMHERDTLIKEIELRKNRELQSTISEMEIKFQKEKKALIRELKEAKASKSLYGLKRQIQDVDEAVKQQYNKILTEAEDQRQRFVADAKAEAEEEKRRAIVELELKNEIALQEKLQAIIQKKNEEKVEALNQLERKLCLDLEPFLEAQKERFLTTLKQMQDSHAKEKVEMQQNYESKLSQLQEECKILVQSQRQQHSYQNNLDKENEELKQSVKLLEDKYRQAEKELLGVIADLKNQLVQKNIELHEKEKLVEQKMHNHEKQVALTSSVSNEIQGLKENIKKAEEEIDNYKLKLEEAEQKYNAVVLKHKTLKEKVRKYHKFIHNKEKDFAYNLLKLNEEHKIALENVAAIKNHVTDVLEKKLGDLKSSFFQIMALKNLPESCPRYENKPEFLVESVKTKDSGQGCRKWVSDLKTEDFQNKFIETARKIHDDIMIYLEDCSRTATKKIEEEMAKASWLLSEHLEIMPKDVKSTETVSVPAPVASSGQMTPCGGSNSQTPTPELTSGRGTMVGNSSSINGNTDNAHHAETQTSTNDFSRSDFVFLSKPLKYWSSTPFTQEYLNGYTIPIVRPTPGISKDTGIHLSELQSDDRRDPKLTYDLAPEKLKSTTDLPLHNPSTVFSSLTWKSINCDSRDGPIPEKLRPAPPPPPSSKTLTMQSASRFEENCSPVVNTTPVFDSDERKSRFIAFTNSLTSLKDEFWRDINSTKMKRPDSITHEKINS